MQRPCFWFKFQSRHPGFSQDALLLELCRSLSGWGPLLSDMLFVGCGPSIRPAEAPRPSSVPASSSPESFSSAWLWVKEGSGGRGPRRPFMLREDPLADTSPSLLSLGPGLGGSPEHSAGPLWIAHVFPPPTGNPPRESSAKAKRSPCPLPGGGVAVLVGGVLPSEPVQTQRVHAPESPVRAATLRSLLGSVTPSSLPTVGSLERSSLAVSEL